jgi:hypothetical protein
MLFMGIVKNFHRNKPLVREYGAPRLQSIYSPITKLIMALFSMTYFDNAMPLLISATGYGGPLKAPAGS